MVWQWVETYLKMARPIGILRNVCKSDEWMVRMCGSIFGCARAAHSP